LAQEPFWLKALSLEGRLGFGRAFGKRPDFSEGLMEGCSGETSAAEAQAAALQAKFQHYLDKTVPWVRVRWGAVFCLLPLFLLRIYLAQGFYVVTYGLGIYLLNILINFLTPAVDPDKEEEGMSLPNKDGEQIFIRKLPEFKAWWNAFKAEIVALFMTCFSCFDLPVFWPILLAYFILLTTLTMKDRIKHMIKHKYVPFSFGKQTYGDLTKVQVPGEKAGGKDSK